MSTSNLVEQPDTVGITIVGGKENAAAAVSVAVAVATNRPQQQAEMNNSKKPKAAKNASVTKKASLKAKPKKITKKGVKECVKKVQNATNAEMEVFLNKFFEEHPESYSTFTEGLFPGL